MKNNLLGHGVWGKELFNGQVIVPTVLHRFSYPFVAFAGEVERLNDTHPLKLLQNRFYQLCLRLLPLRGNAGGTLFHGREDQEVENHTEEGQKTNAPIPRQHKQEHHQ